MIASKNTGFTLAHLRNASCRMGSGVRSLNSSCVYRCVFVRCVSVLQWETPLLSVGVSSVFTSYASVTIECFICCGCVSGGASVVVLGFIVIVRHRCGSLGILVGFMWVMRPLCLKNAEVCARLRGPEKDTLDAFSTLGSISDSTLDCTILCRDLRAMATIAGTAAFPSDI